MRSLFKAFSLKRPSVIREQRVVRCAVVGAGRMGQFHLRHLARHPRAEIVAVVDSQITHARKIAESVGAPAFAQLSELPPIDAAIIATPTATHHALGLELLTRGVSCLIEKPLASSIEEASALIDAAQASGAVLQVGHIERFNPAILEAARHIKNPKFIEVSRLGPYDPRVAGIGVVMDLMIHDLDIVQFLVGETVERVEAFGARVLSDHEDIAKVRLHFTGGCIADLSASRISLEKYRRIRVFQKNAYLSIDYAGPNVKIYRKKSAVVKSLTDIQRLSPKLTKADPLGLEIDHFLGCVLDQKAPLVSGHHGRNALELAQRVLQSLRVDD